MEARGNYYWEQSTRVIAPSVNLELASPEGVEVDGHYLVDTITSASQAAGAQTDVAFTEVRHDAAVGAGYELDLGEQQLHVRASTRFSWEPDYWSTGGGLSAALSLAQRTTTLRGSVFYIHDNVGRKLRGAAAIEPDGTSNVGQRMQVGTLDAVATTLSWDQILTPVLTFQLTYDLNYMTGYLQNAYRQVTINGRPARENHPGTRWRHAVSGRLAYFVRSSRTAFHFMYRAYLDSWDVGAINPELRVYQEVGPHLQLRARYRYYTQTRSYFYRNPDEYEASDTFVSADPKMSEFDSHLVGGRIRLQLGFLNVEWLREASIDASFDWVWRGNRFGDGVIAEAGLRVPF